MHISQEHFTTIVYAKFGGQTECIMGNWKIENCNLVITEFSLVMHGHVLKPETTKRNEQTERNYRNKRNETTETSETTETRKIVSKYMKI